MHRLFSPSFSNCEVLFDEDMMTLAATDLTYDVFLLLFCFHGYTNTLLPTVRIFLKAILHSGKLEVD